MTHKTLDLDELFGQAKAIKVKWNKQEFELRRPEALTPIETNRWDKLQQRIAALKEITDEASDEDLQMLEQAVEDAIQLLNPQLAAEPGLTFAMKVKILQFHAAELMGERQNGAAPAKN